MFCWSVAFSPAYLAEKIPGSSFKELTSIPESSVITGIGAVHLERMKTLENILDAKSEIIDLAGSVVINGDDQLLIDEV